jgi:hypothetical protein
MPRIKYQDYKPKPTARRLIEDCDQILIEYNNNGFDLTLRQLYYQLVSRDLLPDEWADDAGVKNRMESYNKLKQIIARARDAGMLDWEHIKDRTRAVSEYTHYRDLREFIRRFAPQFVMDMWKDQPRRVQVWYEKAALMQIVEQAADPFDVPTFACRGYGSASSYWEAGQRFLEYGNELRPQEVVIIHLGDHDPSGIHMTEDILERIRTYATPWGDFPDNIDFRVERIALNRDQVDEYQPPPDPAKLTDPRAPAYIELHGDQSWELDALDPQVLTELIQGAVQEEMNVTLYNRARQREAQLKNQLREVANNWDEVIEFLRDEGHMEDEDE